MRLKIEEVKHRYREEIEEKWEIMLDRRQDDVKVNINEEWKHIWEIMHETADEVLGRTKLKFKVNFEIYIADRKATTCI